MIEFNGRDDVGCVVSFIVSISSYCANPNRLLPTLCDLLHLSFITETLCKAPSARWISFLLHRACQFPLHASLLPVNRVEAACKV